MRKQGFVALIIVGTLLLASSLACCFSVPDIRIPRVWESVRGSGDVVEEARDVGGFTGVSLEAIGNVYIEQGSVEELRIEAEDNLMPYLETDVAGRTLKIETKSFVNLRPTEPINFYLTVKELDTIVISGSGDIEAPDLQAEDLKVKISGSGDIEMMDLDADRLTVRISGSGDMVVSGEVNDQETTISGSGTYSARDLESKEAEMQISGSGSATIRVSDRLDATVSGSGSVRYIGSPRADTRVSGSGTIRQID